MSEEQEDSRQSQMLPPLQQWLGPLGERLERPLASHRRSAPQVQTCPAANRSFMGHRWQGCGQTGLRNTKTSLKLSSLSHTRHQTWPIIPMPRNSPEWRLASPQIRLTSPKSLICLFKSYTHTEPPQSPGPGILQAEPARALPSPPPVEILCSHPASLRWVPPGAGVTDAGRIASAHIREPRHKSLRPSPETTRQ